MRVLCKYTPFFRISYGATMETMQFHITQMGLLLRTMLFCIKTILSNNLHPSDIVLRYQGRSIYTPGVLVCPIIKP